MPAKVSMHPVIRVFVSASCALALSACGGGGGGTSTAAPAPIPTPPIPTPPVVVKPDQGWLTLTPASQDLTTYPDEPLTFTINARSSKTFSKPVNVAIVDSVGVISTNVKIDAVSITEYLATLQTSSVLTVGTHTTNLELRLCEDDAKMCKTPLEGSPWSIPLKVTVKSGTNLTTLRATPFMANWSTYQGNASHTGYVPASFDVNKFARRWTLPASATTSELVPLVHDNGKVFGVYSGYFSTQSTLVAWSEDTGKEVWRVDLGAVPRANPAAAANGKVYLATSGHESTFFWVFDQATGQLQSKKSMSAQWERYLAPTVYGDTVYTNSGYYGGMSKFSTVTNDLLWATTALPQYDGWTPAVDGTYAYTFIGGSLYAVNVGDGTVAYKIEDIDNSWSGYTGTVPVLSDGQSAFIVNGGRLVAFDLAAKTRLWSANGTAVGQPVYAKKVLYAMNAAGTVLEAHSPSTGAMLWTSQSLNSGEIFNKLLVTDNLAFVSSEKVTLAIDLTTRQVVWNYPLGGDLSISNRGVLYISGQNRKIAAINLE